MCITSLLQKPAVRFLVAGSAGYLTFYTLLIVLTEWVGLWYLASSMIALIVNYIVTFILQKLWTFKDSSTHVLHKQIVLYSLMVTGFYVSNAVLLYMLVEYAGLWYLVAQILISLLLTVASFLISRRLFAPEPPTAN